MQILWMYRKVIRIHAYTVVDPGFPIGGHGPIGGDMDL